MGKATSQAPSRRRVACGYPDCSYEAELRMLKRHTRTVHLSALVKIQNSSFGVGGQWHKWCTKRGSAKNAPVSATTPQDEERTSMESEPAGSAKDVPVSATTPQDDERTNMESEPAESSSSTLTALQLSNRNLSSRMTTLEQTSSTIVRLLQKSNVTLDHQDPDSVAKTGAQRAFRSARSIGELKEASGGLLTSSYDEKMLSCSVCAEDACSDDNSTRPGIFKYDFQVGASFTYAQVLPPTFRNLKDRVRKHFLGERHECAFKTHSDEAEASATRRAHSGNVSLRVLRTGYHVLKKSLAQTSFEDLIVLQHSNGLDMGDINHSKMLMRQLRESFSEAITEKVKAHVLSQPCVALMADKVTVNRRTMDITAICTVVPSAPVEHMMQSLVVGAPVVKGHDGDAQAGELQETIAAVGITHTDQLSAICADGQLHHNSVPEKLLKNIRSKGCQSSPACVPSVWDGSHLMNLADADARKSAACSWVDSTVAKVTKITKRFTHGKGLEDLHDAGAELGVQVFSPRLWSDTRFAPHAAEVLRAFCRNIDTMSLALRKRIAVETKDSVVADMQDDSRCLKDNDFLARVSALLDVYAVLSSGSRVLQTVQQMPWDTMKGFDSAIRTTKRMAVVLEASLRRDAATAEVVNRAEKDTFWPSLAKHQGYSKDVIKDAAAFCHQLAQRLLHRRSGQSSTGSLKGTSNQAILNSMPDIREVADLQQIRNSKTDITVRLIKEAASRLVSRRIIPRSCDVPEASIRAAFSVLHEERCATGTQQQLLKALWRASNDRPEIRLFVDVVIRLWLVSPTESVVESMGSVVQEVFGAHRQLDHGNAAKELIVRWNGPAVNKADDLIRAVQRKQAYNFTRRTGSIKRALDGTVITRHRTATCPRQSLYQ